MRKVTVRLDSADAAWRFVESNNPNFLEVRVLDGAGQLVALAENGVVTFPETWSESLRCPVCEHNAFEHYPASTSVPRMAQCRACWDWLTY